MKNLLNKVVLFVAVAAATCLCLRADDLYEEIDGIVVLNLALVNGW